MLCIQGICILMTFSHICAKRGWILIQILQGVRPGLVVPVLVLSVLLCVDTCFLIIEQAAGMKRTFLSLRVA